MKTLSAQATAQKALSGVTLLWLVDASFDEYGLATQDYNWASEDQYTISGTTYDGLISPDGIEVDWSRVNPRGGFASVAGWRLKLRDESGLSEIGDTYVLANDDLVLYGVFVNGSEVSSDRVELTRGVIETHKSAGNVWSLKMKDGSKKLLKDFPSRQVEPIRFANAYAHGMVLPVPFGNLNVGPDDGAGLSPLLAPVRMLDQFALEGTSGFQNKTATTLYQFYPDTGYFAEVLTSSTADGIVTATDPARKLILRGVREATANDVTDWHSATDGDTSAGVTIGTGDNLDFWFAGSSKLGYMTAASIVVTCTSGTAAYTVYKGTTSKHSGTGSGTFTITLTLSDWSDWDLGLLNIALAGSSGDATITDVKVDVRFDDPMAFWQREPRFFQKATCFEDQVANYADGAVITGAGTVLRNPVHQLEAMLRGGYLIGLETATIGSSFAAMASYRTDWHRDFPLSGRKTRSWLDTYGFEAGLHIFPEAGKIECAAMEKSRDPQHFFSGDWDMPVQNAAGKRAEWDYDFKVLPVDASEIINEIALRYRRNPGTGVYEKAKIASGEYRWNGTGGTLAATTAPYGTLTKAGEDFSSTAVVGETVYIGGDVAYTIYSVDSDTQLTLEDESDEGYVSDLSDVDYWGGPNLRAECLLSQLSYKTVNALGTRQTSFTDDGGYKTDLIAEDDPADEWVDWLVEWFTQPRDGVAFSVFHNAVDVQMGDVLMLEHEKLQPSKRPVPLTELSGALNSSSTTFSVSIGEGSLLRPDDWIVLITSAGQPEAMQVDSVSTDTVTVVARGALGTTGIAHSSGEVVYRVTTKWLVTGTQMPTYSRPYVGIEAVQMPNSYFPVGICVADSAPDWGAATPAERVQSGWATLRNGRVVDLDSDSNISYAM